MVRRFSLQAFFKHCQQAWCGLKDHRKPSPNTTYTLSDAVNSAFSVFFMQSQSFLSHHQVVSGKKKGKKNLNRLFEVKKVPSDNQIRNLLDPIDPNEFAGQFAWIWKEVKELGGLKQYETALKTTLIALDGMTYHSSTKISCDCCTVRHDRNGVAHYYHSALLPVMVKPRFKHILPLFPELITPQDGKEKQDCEREASKRWIAQWANSETGLFEPFTVTFLGDDLFSNDPLCRQINSQNQRFIFVCKLDSHTTLYNCLASLDCDTLTERQWKGRHGEVWLWKWVNDVPLKAGDDAFHANWCELLITHEKTGDVLYHNSWVTNHLLTEKNVKPVAECGRTRWKVENEGINVLKTKGYHIEHNFGHGKQHLSQVLLILNLLAFLLHTALHLIDDLYRFLRKALYTRKTFFDDIRSVCRYNYFLNWTQLWLFMIESLDDDDIPPEILALIPN